MHVQFRPASLFHNRIQGRSFSMSACAKLSKKNTAVTPQLTFTCLNSMIETLEKSVKYVQNSQ